MENRVGSILKEFEYKWVSSVREMVRKMEKELTGVEESPIKDCQSAFWVTPSNESNRSSDDGGDEEDEDAENVPPKTPRSSSVKRVQKAGETPACHASNVLERKRKLTSVVSYLEAQHKANKRRKDSQPDGTYQLYRVTPTAGSPQSLNTRRILNFEGLEEPTNENASSPLQDIEVVGIYQDTGTNKNIYFTPSPNSVAAGQDSSNTSVSFDAEELLKQICKSRDLPENAHLHFRVRNAGVRTVRQTPFAVMTPIDEADDDSE